MSTALVLEKNSSGQSSLNGQVLAPHVVTVEEVFRLLRIAERNGWPELAYTFNTEEKIAEVTSSMAHLTRCIQRYRYHVNKKGITPEEKARRLHSIRRHIAEICTFNVHLLLCIALGRESIR